MSSQRRGRGRGGYWGGWRPQTNALRTRTAPEDTPSPSPPLGDLVEAITREHIGAATLDVEEPCDITGTELVASYNWTDDEVPKIIIPGKPPLWTPPSNPPQLSEDKGVFYRDRNAASFPNHPMEPAVKAVMWMRPVPDLGPIDVFACRSTLGSLLRYVRGVDKPFRMLVEVVGETVHLVRRENTPKEQIPGVRGYGHTFPEAYTTWEPDVRRSLSHQRIIKYRLGGLDLMVLFEGDGYIDPDKALELAFYTKDTLDPVEHFGDLRLSPKSGLGNSTRLEIVSAGEVTPQNCIFDIKTRSIRVQDTDTLADELPRLWLSQIPKFILAHHTRGLFKDVQVKDVAADVQEWEKQNQSVTKQLVALLCRISLVAMEKKDVELELVRKEGGPLEMRERLSDAGSVFSPLTRELWEDWLDDWQRANASAVVCNAPESPFADQYCRWDGDESFSDESSDESSKDFTACDRECGYCGKCPY